jgi:hypothetical protein
LGWIFGPVAEQGAENEGRNEMDFESLLTPDARQAEGVWVFHADSEMEFRVASMRQRAYQDFVAQRYNAARRGRRDIPPEAANRILVEGLLRYVLKDWRPKGTNPWFVTKDGQPVPFSKENASKLLNAESNDAARIRDFLVEESGNDYNFSTSMDGEVDFGERDQPANDQEPGDAAGLLKSGPQVEPPVGPGT